MRKIIHIDESRCNGCGRCVSACAEGAIEIANGKARLVCDPPCDGLGACLGECPTGALKIVERQAAPFDEAAVAAALCATAPACPSMRIHVLDCGSTAEKVPMHAQTARPSGLGHWPVQTRLVSPRAPFLQDAELFVAADCVPVAWPGFHKAIPGKVVMVGCPKFDEVETYLERFREVFEANDIQRVTVAVMQVPCCQGLPRIVKEGMRLAGKQVPLEKTAIAVDGAPLQSSIAV